MYELSQENMHMNDTYADIHNSIFNLIKYYKEYHSNPNPTPPTNSIIPLPPTTPIQHSYKYAHGDGNILCKYLIYVHTDCRLILTKDTKDTPDLLSEGADTSGTALARASSNSKLQTRPLVREDATKYQTAIV
jgi:hypothetical protein